jgi:hypothetical protein
MKRSTAATIFKTVVFAGAMLGSAAGCGKKQAPAAPKATEADKDKKVEPPKEEPLDGDRPRGTGEEDPEGGGEGRGFILS